MGIGDRVAFAGRSLRWLVVDLEEDRLVLERPRQGSTIAVEARRSALVVVEAARYGRGV